MIKNKALKRSSFVALNCGGHKESVGIFFLKKDASLPIPNRVDAN